MTEMELEQSLTMILTNYNKAMNDNILALWKGLFINFDANFFRMACLKIISKNKFFPNASEVIEAYQYIRQQASRDRYDRLKENQRLLSQEQTYCYLCDNSGICKYLTSESKYEYVSRCLCSHGRNLNRFSEAQTDPEYKPECMEYYRECDKLAIKHGKNPFYIQNIKEVMGNDFAVYDAWKKNLFLSREEINDEKKAELLKKIKNAI